MWDGGSARKHPMRPAAGRPVVRALVGTLLVAALVVCGVDEQRDCGEWAAGHVARTTPVGKASCPGRRATTSSPSPSLAPTARSATPKP